VGCYHAGNKERVRQQQQTIPHAYHPMVFQIIENSHEKAATFPLPLGEGRARGETLKVWHLNTGLK
jgi:hypothetical protein